MKAKKILKLYESDNNEEIYQVISQYFIKKFKSIGADITSVSYPLGANNFPLAVFTVKNTNSYKRSVLMRQFKRYADIIMRIVGKSQCGLVVGSHFVEIKFFFKSMTFKDCFLALRMDLFGEDWQEKEPKYYTINIDFGISFVSEYSRKKLPNHDEFVDEKHRSDVVYSLIDFVAKAVRLTSFE